MEEQWNGAPAHFSLAIRYYINEKLGRVATTSYILNSPRFLSISGPESMVYKKSIEICYKEPMWTSILPPSI